VTQAKSTGPLLPRQTLNMANKISMMSARDQKSSIFSTFMDRHRVEVCKRTKAEQGQYSAILMEHAWSVRDLVHGSGKIVWLNAAQDLLHLALSQSQPYDKWN